MFCVQVTVMDLGTYRVPTTPLIAPFPSFMTRCWCIVLVPDLTPVQGKREDVLRVQREQPAHLHPGLLQVAAVTWPC